MKALLLTTALLLQQALAPLERLREWTELDLVRELVVEGRPLVAEGGELARSGEARALVARALHGAGEEAAALALVDPASVPEAERAWLVLERARFHLLADELSSVTRLLDPEGDGRVRFEAEHPDALLLAARALDRAGELQRAVPLAQRFLQRAALHPEASAAWHLLARAALQLDQAERAREFLDRAAYIDRWHAVLQTRRMQIRRTPDEPLPRLGLALAWMEVEAWDRARPVLEELVRAHPTFARGWVHLGEVQRLVGELDAAYASYGRALDVDPSAHLARYNRAQLDLLRDDTERARQGFEALLAIDEVANDPTYAGAWLQLARLADDRGDAAESTRYLQRYRDLGGTEPLRE